jgi:hypothetical protein
MLQFGTALVKHSVEDRHHVVSVVHPETSADMVDLRDNHADWHEGALSLLTYPTAQTRGSLSHEPPKMFGGIQFMPGAYITKDEAGNFGILRDEAAFVPQEAGQQ